MPAPSKVNTATLIRGETYALRHPDNTPANPVESLRFEIGNPVVIEDRTILDLLEAMYIEAEDSDGEVYEKPLFLVERGVAAPDQAQRGPKRTRVSSKAPVKKRTRRR